MRNVFKSLWLSIIFLTSLRSASAVIPDVKVNDSFTSAVASTLVQNEIGLGIINHRLSWYIATGSLSGCSVKLEQSLDQSSWSDLIAGQTCTSNGSSTVTTGTANYVRINVTSFTGSSSPSLTVTYTGWVDRSAAGTPGGSDTQVQFNDAGAFNGNAGLVYNKTTNALTGVIHNLTQGTITSDAPQLNGTVTWSNAGIVGPAWKLNATDTSSDPAALFADFQVGGVSKWKLDKTGKVTQAGSLVLPAAGALINTVNLAAIGGADRLSIGVTNTSAANQYVYFNSGSPEITIRSGWALGFSSSATDPVNNSADTKILRDGAGILAQRNGTNAQAARWFNTYTSSTNGEYLTADWQAVANQASLWTVKGSGGGTARDLVLGTDATDRFRILADGTLLKSTVPTLIRTAPTQGASSIAGNPLTISASDAVAGSSNAGAAAGGAITIQAGNAARLTSGNAAGGNILLQVGTGIGTGGTGLVQIGGTSSSFAGFKNDTLVSTGKAAVRLADDSAWGGLALNNIYFFTSNSTTNKTMIVHDSSGVPLISMASGGVVRWSNSATDGTTGYDIGIARNAAGVAEINNATGGTFRDLKVRHLTAGINVAPSIASGFGTSPSIAGGDDAGRVTVGTGGTATTGAVTFGTAYSTAPACVANDETTVLVVQASATTTTLTLTAATPFGAADKLTWNCETY